MPVFQTVLFGVFLYFLLASSLVVLLFIPAARQVVFESVAKFLRRLQRVREQGQSVSSQTLFAAFRVGVLSGGFLLRHGRGLALAALVLVSLPMVVVWLRHAAPASTFDHRLVRPSDDRVAALLAGEQLAPPPPLPPEMFLRAELLAERPQLGSANREWSLLDQEFRQRLLVVFQLLKERHGYEAVLLEGFRSPDRQAALKAKGSAVTQAGAFESYHQYGLAADVAFVRGGRIVISERDPWVMKGYELYGEVAVAAGLTWGGAWSSLKDYGHVELRRPGVLRTGAAAADAAQRAH